MESYTIVLGTIHDCLKNHAPVFFVGPAVINRRNYVVIGFRQPFENCTISRSHVTGSRRLMEKMIFVFKQSSPYRRPLLLCLQHKRGNSDVM